MEDAFSKYGKVVEARVITDRETGRPRGFGFVTFETSVQADDALAAMNGFELQGREIRVDKPTPKGAGGDRAPRRDFGGRGGSGGGGSQECFDFQKGNCRYGDSCRFSHGGRGGGGGGRDRDRDRDRGYDRGNV